MSSDRRTTWLTQRRFARRSPAPTCGTAGFFEFVLVPAPVSARQKGGSGPSVSASKNSVPDSDVRDRFDDWVVGLQFVPDYLHHPVSRYRTLPVIRAFVARTAGFSSSFSSPPQSLQDKKADLDPPSLHRKIPFPTRMS